MTAKDELSDLVEGLAEDEAGLWLAAWHGDLLAWKLLTAPVDDEPETDRERAAAERGRQALREGRVKSSAEVRRQLLW
jgi:hypothetical protein